MNITGGREREREDKIYKHMQPETDGSNVLSARVTDVEFYFHIWCKIVIRIYHEV
jgi:hypothetical protein